MSSEHQLHQEDEVAHGMALNEVVYGMALQGGISGVDRWRGNKVDLHGPRDLMYRLSQGNVINVGNSDTFLIIALSYKCKANLRMLQGAIRYHVMNWEAFHQTNVTQRVSWMRSMKKMSMKYKPLWQEAKKNDRKEQMHRHPEGEERRRQPQNNPLPQYDRQVKELLRHQNR